MKPTLIHRVCARPFAISWLLGAVMLWIPVTMSLRDEGVFSVALSQPTIVLWLLLAYACLGGIGLFAGTFTLFWLVVRVCRRINGAPFVVGDLVTIIVGPHAGTTTTVYELTVGQGGGLLPRLDLGADVAAKYLDIFDDYSLLRASRSEVRSGYMSASLKQVIL